MVGGFLRPLEICFFFLMVTTYRLRTTVLEETCAEKNTKSLQREKARELEDLAK